MDVEHRKAAIADFLGKFSGHRPALEPHVPAAQVLRRLAEIEADATAYYEGLAAHTDLDWVRKFCSELAAAERNHQRHFLELARAAEDAHGGPGSTMDAPLTDELIRLMSARITQAPESTAKTAAYIGEKDAVDFAILAEANTVELLTRLLDHVQEAQRDHIRRVLREEVTHQLYLEELRAKHFGAGEEK